MFIRRTSIKSRKTGEPYYTYRLVESVREGGRVRQRTLLNLRRHFEGGESGNANAAFGRSKEKRSDCVLITLALVLDASGFPKRSEVFAGNAGEPKTLAAMVGKLASKQTGTTPTVVLDTGIATEENIAWLREHEYHYVVVSRKRHRQFDPDAAVVIIVRRHVKSGLGAELCLPHDHRRSRSVVWRPTAP